MTERSYTCRFDFILDGQADLLMPQAVAVYPDIGILPVQRDALGEQVFQRLIRLLGQPAGCIIVDPGSERCRGHV